MRIAGLRSRRAALLAAALAVLVAGTVPFSLGTAQALQPATARTGLTADWCERKPKTAGYTMYSLIWNCAYTGRSAWKGGCCGAVIVEPAPVDPRPDLDKHYPFMALNLVNNTTLDAVWVDVTYKGKFLQNACFAHPRGTTLGVKIYASMHGADGVVRDLTFRAAQDCATPPAPGAASVAYTVMATDTDYDAFRPYQEQPRLTVGTSGTAPTSLLQDFGPTAWVELPL